MESTLHPTFYLEIFVIKIVNVIICGFLPHNYTWYDERAYVIQNYKK